MADIKKHPFFKNLSFDEVYNLNVKPPFVPSMVLLFLNLSKSGEDDYKFIDPNIKQIVGDSFYCGMSLERENSKYY